MTASRVITWEVRAIQGYETSWIEFGERVPRAHGRAVGARPEPYWITYELDSADGVLTRRLRVTAESAHGTRTPAGPRRARGEGGRAGHMA
ncbi:hypothetical protein ABT124_23405 [Streptomyces sp. NPDC001982]|uniref:hypothetical protein n=1 Tax=unclassified Streptomyces TaxID=2593676 RepID=UPI0033342D0E